MPVSPPLRACAKAMVTTAIPASASPAAIASRTARRRPAAARPAAASGTPPQPERGHAEQQGRGDQHLHDRQRAGTQRDRMGDESAELDADAEQPPRAPHQQQEQPGPARRLAGRRGGLALLQCGTGSVEDGRDQRPHQGRHRSTPGQAAGDAAPGGATAAEGLFVLSLVADSAMRLTLATRYIASPSGIPPIFPRDNPSIAPASRSLTRRRTRRPWMPHLHGYGSGPARPACLALVYPVYSLHIARV